MNLLSSSKIDSSGTVLAPVPSARREWDDLARSVVPFVAGLDEGQRSALRPILIEDVASEYDARFLTDYLYSLDLEYTAAFRTVEAAWAVDEERHYRKFRDVVCAGWGDDCAWLADREPDFRPLEHLFEDEFSILVLCAYDELATVRAYRANLEQYDRLGPELSVWVRAVIADEAWHYSRFLDVIRREHAHRLGEGTEAIRRVRETEGVAYAATFVLDHDDAVFTDEIFDHAARIVARQLAREVPPVVPDTEE
ncbi:MAG: hypothetical protein GY711_18690 [bacterium]|nr:hypothetical protein [bacterium]